MTKVDRIVSVRPVRLIRECCVNGEVSTETLQKKYGYNQPPRAARDVRELGFLLKTKNVKSSDGKKMAVYTLGDLSRFSPKCGRVLFTKAEKLNLIKKDGTQCFYCLADFPANALQIDHKIPYEIAGNEEHQKSGEDALALVCASCNRRKSWSCEGCSNFSKKELSVCRSCYWTNPDNYTHLATQNFVVLNLTLSEKDSGYASFNNKTRSEILQILNSVENF